MPSPIKSIRWRFVLWLAFLLSIVLAGFGVTAYQLHSNNQFAQLDEELKSRTAVLSAVLRTPPGQFNRGPRGFGPGGPMDPRRDDREPFGRDNLETRPGTNGPPRPDRPFDGGPPRRFFPDDELPNR